MIENLCKELGFGECKLLDPRQFGIRKRIEIAKSDDRCLFYIERKSRFVTKDANDLLAIARKVCQKPGVLLLAAPLCSKARRILENEGWDVRTVG